MDSTTLAVSRLLATFLAVTVASVGSWLARSLIASRHSTHTVRPRSKSVHCWHAGYEHSLQCEKTAERLRFSQTRHNSRTGVLFSFPASSLGSVSLLSGLASGLSIAVRRGGFRGNIGPLPWPDVRPRRCGGKHRTGYLLLVSCEFELEMRTDFCFAFRAGESGLTELIIFHRG